METNHRPHNICLVGPAWPYRGGIAHFLQSMDRHLREAGHSVSIVTFTRQYPAWLFPGSSQYEKEPSREWSSDDSSSQRIVDSINPLSWKKAVQHISDLGAEVVIFSYWNPFFALSFGRIAHQLRLSGTKVLALLHNALPHERRIGDKWLGQYFFKQCDAFLVLSEQVQKDLKQMVHNAPVARASHPVYDIFGESPTRERARQKLGLREDQQVLLFFGHVRPYKGLSVLLEALPRLVDSLPKVHLCIAGEFYEQFEHYTRLIKKLGLEEKVSVHPHYIPNDEVGLFFSACDLVVQPYLATTQSGVAQLAYHYCRPIIVTNVGELRELVLDGETGYVVPPNQPDCLSDAVLTFFNHADRAQFSKRIEELKPLYSWDTLVEKTVSLIESLR